MQQNVHARSKPITLEMFGFSDYIQHIAARLLIDVQIKEVGQVFVVGYLGLGILYESNVSNHSFWSARDADACDHTRKEIRVKSFLLLPFGFLQKI